MQRNTGRVALDRAVVRRRRNGEGLWRRAVQTPGQQRPRLILKRLIERIHRAGLAVHCGQLQPTGRHGRPKKRQPTACRPSVPTTADRPTARSNASATSRMSSAPSTSDRRLLLRRWPSLAGNLGRSNSRPLRAVATATLSSSFRAVVRALSHRAGCFEAAATATIRARCGVRFPCRRRPPPTAAGRRCRAARGRRFEPG